MFVEGESGKNFDDTMHSMVANARERIARPAQRVGKAVKAAFKAMPSISYDLPHEAGIGPDLVRLARVPDPIARQVPVFPRLDDDQLAVALRPLPVGRKMVPDGDVRRP